MGIIIGDGPHRGHVIHRLPLHTSSQWLHRGTESFRYVGTGATDAATGYEMFKLSPLALRPQENHYSRAEIGSIRAMFTIAPRG